MPCPDSCAIVVPQLLVYGLTNGAVVALNAVGFSLAYAVARQINLAHGNVFTLTTVVVASLADAMGISARSSLTARVAELALLILGGAACGAILNVGVERLAFRPFREGRDRLAPLIATVAVSFLLSGAAVGWKAATTVAKPYHQGVDVPLLAMPDLLPVVELGWGGVSFTLKDAFVLVLAAAVIVGGSFLLTRSRVGRLLRAVAQDPELAATCGVDPVRAQTLAFAVAGALAGFGAAIFAAYYGEASAQYGLRSGLSAMTAAVLGGVGDPGGALLGGIVLGIFTSFDDYLLPDARWTPVLVLALFAALLAFRPTGLLGMQSATSSEDVPAPAPPTVAVQSRRQSRWWLAILLALALAYPVLDRLADWNRLSTATQTLLLVTLALGLSIVVSYAGLLDLGYAAFFAIGGYTTALLTSSGSQLAEIFPLLAHNPWLTLPLAGLAAAGCGVVCGLACLRTRGEYLAIITLAFGEIVPSVLLYLPDWTGGPRGLSGIPPLRLGPWDPDSPLHGYAIALALAGIACLVAMQLATSRIGRAWGAVRDDEVAAGAVGVDAWRVKLLAFAIGATYAGVAGPIFVELGGYVEPSQFDFTLSMLVLSAVVVGGRWGVPGVILGAVIVSVYDRSLVEILTAALRALGTAVGSPILATADLRGNNYILIGLALYLATLGRAPRAV